MAFNLINIQRLIVKQDEQIVKLLFEILDKLNEKDEPMKQEIMNKLEKAIADIKSTI